MHKDFDEMLEVMECAFCDLENMLKSKPKLTHLSFGTTFRYQDMTIYEALIQKLARAQSFTRAARVLNLNGFVQEQAALHRTIDETNDDIIFLVLGAINNITDLHKKYLEAFWEEEVDETGNLMDSAQKRPMIPRKKIQAYLSNTDGMGNPSRSVQLSRTLSKVYSGFVHGASPHIMEMYGGKPAKFHIKGMLDTPRFVEYGDDLWNYMYRTFLSHIFIAMAFGAEEQVKALTTYKEKFEIINMEPINWCCLWFSKHIVSWLFDDLPI